MNAEGIFMAERIFGSTILNSDGKGGPFATSGAARERGPGPHSFLPRLDSGVAHAPVDVRPEAGEDSGTLSGDFDALQHFLVVSPLRPFPTNLSSFGLYDLPILTLLMKRP